MGIHTVNATAQANESNHLPGYICPMAPLRLAQLNLGLLGSLFSLGTSRERICEAMLLSDEEYDYVTELAGLTR